MYDKQLVHIKRVSHSHKIASCQMNNLLLKISSMIMYQFYSLDGGTLRYNAIVNHAKRKQNPFCIRRPPTPPSS